MEYNVVIAGCRDYTDYAEAAAFLDEILPGLVPGGSEPVFFSGKCRGADALGERYAREHGFRVVAYPADWSLGRRAGPLRNERMAHDADAVVCFWDGQSRGTASMIRYARQYGRALRVFRIDEKTKTD